MVNSNEEVIRRLDDVMPMFGSGFAEDYELHPIRDEEILFQESRQRKLNDFLIPNHGYSVPKEVAQEINKQLNEMLPLDGEFVQSLKKLIKGHIKDCKEPNIDS